MRFAGFSSTALPLLPRFPPLTAAADDEDDADGGGTVAASLV